MRFARQRRQDFGAIVPRDDDALQAEAEAPRHSAAFGAACGPSASDQLKKLMSVSALVPSALSAGMRKA
jgi:hypothetical protein